MTQNLDDLAPDLISFLPPSIAIEIGNSTVAFSLVEDELNQLIWELLNSGKVAGQAVTFTIRNITDRIELARTLAKDKAVGDVQQEILNTLNRVGELSKRRNTLIHHALVEIKFESDPIVTYRKKDSLIREKPQQTIFKGSDFKTLTSDLRLLFRALDGAAKSYALARARAARQLSKQTQSGRDSPPKDRTDLSG